MHPWHASELVSFLVGLRTYQHPGSYQYIFIIASIITIVVGCIVSASLFLFISFFHFVHCIVICCKCIGYLFTEEFSCFRTWQYFSIVSFQQTHAPYLISVLLLFLCIIVSVYLYRMSRGECARCLEIIPYIKLHWYNHKNLYPKFNGYR